MARGKRTLQDAGDTATTAITTGAITDTLRRDSTGVAGITGATDSLTGGTLGGTTATTGVRTGVIQSETASSGLDAAANRAEDAQKLVGADALHGDEESEELLLSSGSGSGGDGDGVLLAGGDASVNALSDYSAGDYSVHASSLEVAAAGGSSGNALLHTHGGHLHRRDLQPHPGAHGALGVLVTFLVLVHVMAVLVWLRACWRQRTVKAATMRPTMPPQKVNCTYDMDKPGFSLPKIELPQLGKVYKAQQA